MVTTTRSASDAASITSLHVSGVVVMSDEAWKAAMDSPDAFPWAETARAQGYVTKDSGAREEMPTGSVRDTREGKGRFDLISPFALRRLAGVYERGSKKYKDRNWEKGQTYSRCLDSALRHLNSFAMGWTDEDHLAQALWNVAAILHFQETGRTELDDMPHYQKGPTDA
jgi:hypothetical protein